MTDEKKIEQSSIRKMADNENSDGDGLDVNISENTIQQATVEKKGVSPLVQGIIWVILFGFLAFIGSGLLRAQKSIIAIGEPVADFSLTTFSDEEFPEGQIIRLSDLKGKVVVINFWASWC